MDNNLILKQLKHFKMYLLKDDPGISKALMSSENREPAFMHLIRENVQSGDFCMDIGANLGYVSLFLAHLVGCKGRVYAVEPDIQNYKVLLNNILLNPGESIVHNRVAISDITGRTTFYPSSKSNLGGLQPGKNTNSKPYDVETQTLDFCLIEKYIIDNPVLPTFYKMDVEGAEVLILNGMHEVAKRSKSGTKILMEIHPREYGPDLDMRKALTDIVALGFRFKYLISAGLAQPKIFKDKGYEPIKTFDCGSVWKRGLYNNVSTVDAIDFCSEKHAEYIPEIKKTTGKSVRALMLEKI